LLDHHSFSNFREIIVQHPSIRTAAEKRLFNNPYFLGFLAVFGLELADQYRRFRDTGTKELIEIFFDEAIDNRKRLEHGFDAYVKAVCQGTQPEALELLINKQAEFRDDKLFLPLQAADLLAWHARRHMYEHGRGYQHDDRVWKRLIDNQRIRYGVMFYGAKQLQDLLIRYVASLS
jgi:hypothetical protein